MGRRKPTCFTVSSGGVLIGIINGMVMQHFDSLQNSKMDYFMPNLENLRSGNIDTCRPT